MVKEKKDAEIKRHKHRRRIWLWFFLVILIFVGAATWVLHDAGMINWQGIKQIFVSEEKITTDTDVQPVLNSVDEVTTEVVEIKPACTVIEELLLSEVVSDNNNSSEAQFNSARIYNILAERGCPENSQFFKDMAARKQTISEGLSAMYSYENNAMTSAEYLYSDEKICQTIEKRVMQNINPNAYEYYEFLNNANTYSVLYQYGCRSNRAAYSRAAIRELAIAMALQPAEHMNDNEIIMIVEVYKRLGVANLAHLVIQRLKARGYDMEFLLSLEDIVHGIR